MSMDEQNDILVLHVVETIPEERVAVQVNISNINYVAGWTKAEELTVSYNWDLALDSKHSYYLRLPGHYSLSLKEGDWVIKNGELFIAIANDQFDSKYRLKSNA